MSPHLILISHVLCPYVQRAVIVLKEKGVCFERRDVDLANKPDWFKACSPLGKTPVLLVDDVRIFESAVICEYLEDTLTPRLHPNDALIRAQHRACCSERPSSSGKGGVMTAQLDPKLIPRTVESQTVAVKVPREVNITLISSFTIITLIAIWWLVTTLGWIDALFLPSPTAVLQRFNDLFSNGYMSISLWSHIGASLGRIGTALIAAVITAIPVGIAIGRNKIVRGILDPIIEFYRPIPPLAYLPLIVIWCGIGELSKVLLIYLAIFAPIVIATATGVRSVDQAKIRAAQSLGASPMQIIKHVVLPSSLPSILTGIRIGLGVGWSTLVAAELVGASEGLGFMVQSSSQLLATDVVIVGILIIAVIAFILEIGLRRLQRKLVPWDKQSQ